MIDANFFIFVQPQNSSRPDPTTGIMCCDIYYITDTNKSRVYCAQPDLLMALRREYGFAIDVADEIRDKVNSGVTLVIDLESKNYRIVPQEVITARGVTRANQQEAPNIMEQFFDKSERAPGIVNRKFKD
jgi:hypothetical protein